MKLPAFFLAVVTAATLTVPISTASLRAATAPQTLYPPAQTEAASMQVAQALKAAGAASLQKATLKQLSDALASIVATNKSHRHFLGAVAYTVVKARPELAIPVARILVDDYMYPDDCPQREYLDEIIQAIITANPDSAPELRRELLEDYPCRALIINHSLLEALNPATSSQTGSTVQPPPAGTITTSPENVTGE